MKAKRYQAVKYTSFIVKILSIVSRIALTSLVWIRYNEASGYFYDKANVLISLAGCFTLGAKRGVLSFPARHYTEKCEVYGYLPESKDFSLSDSEGYNVIPFLKEVIDMPFDEYLKHCRDCYEAFPIQNQKYFDQIKNKSKSVLSNREILYINCLSIHNKVKDLLRKVKKNANGN